MVRVFSVTAYLGRVGQGAGMWWRWWWGGEGLHAGGFNSEAATVVFALISLSSPNPVCQGVRPVTFLLHLELCAVSIHSPEAHSVLCTSAMNRDGDISFCGGWHNPSETVLTHAVECFCFLFCRFPPNGPQAVVVLCCCSVPCGKSFLCAGLIVSVKKWKKGVWALVENPVWLGTNHFSLLTGLFVLVSEWSCFHGVPIADSYKKTQKSYSIIITL